MSTDPSTQLPKPSAFPITVPVVDGATYYDPGMTLRDYFAGQVLLGCCNDPTFVKRVNKTTGNDAEAGRAITAASAYAMADAMLAARKEASDES